MIKERGFIWWLSSMESKKKENGQELETLLFVTCFLHPSQLSKQQFQPKHGASIHPARKPIQSLRRGRRLRVEPPSQVSCLLPY